MKNIKYVLIALLGLSVSSCQDAIDIVQPGELYATAVFKTVNDMQLYLNGVYANMSEYTDISHSSIWTDEVRLGAANTGQGITNDGEYTFTLNPLSGYTVNLWSSSYALIYHSNLLIQGAKLITPKPEELDAYNDILTQAHIMRAWGHFKLLSYYSTDLTDDNALGVILVDHVPGLSEQLPRTTNGKVFELINKDLGDYTFSATYNNLDNSNRTFLSPDFVKAFRARMAAYREDYATALPLANELIAAYPLTPVASYANIWKDAPVPVNEVIFKLERVTGDTKVGGLWASGDSTISGSPIYEVSTDLYSLLSVPGDIRKSAFVSPTATADIHPIAKYPGSGGINLLNDLKVFRTSEMVFIKAEAAADAGDLAGVVSALQLINNARFTGAKPPIPFPATVELAWAEILKQRRIELCYEGHRYRDFKRLGVKAGVSLSKGVDCAGSECEISNTDHRLTMPIPRAEIQANQAIKNQQNPGY